MLRRLWNYLLAEPLSRVEQETRDYLDSPLARGVDRVVVVVLATAAVCLTFNHYFSSPEALVGALRVLVVLGLESQASQAEAVLSDWQANPLARLAWWGGNSIITYFVLPALVCRFVLRRPLREFGVKLSGAFAGFPIYLTMLGVMLPIILLVSASGDFQETYPFYPVQRGESLGWAFWCWELIYGLQFVALEFFFRGFILHGTRRRFGVYAVFVMMVPYCMIHYGKPLPEALASIVAAVALGFMSLATRSIWMGALLHITVAWSMDLVVLCRKGVI